MSKKDVRPDILVTIEAPAGTGKTTLVELFRRGLSEAGFDVTIEDDESPDFSGRLRSEPAHALVGRLNEIVSPKGPMRIRIRTKHVKVTARKKFRRRH